MRACAREKSQLNSKFVDYGETSCVTGRRMLSKGDLCSLSHVKEELPCRQDSEQSKVYLSQKPPAAAARSWAPREKDPGNLNFKG